MATQLWNQEIDKTVDWGGDTSTNSQPVSGKFVQKFIKDTLASKFGYLHYNSDTKKYQVFADESDFNTWNSDQATYANLLLATFDAPAPATIKVEMLSDLSNTVLSTETGNEIRFKYIVNDSSNSPITESVTVRLQVTNNGITQTYTFPYGVDYDTYKTGTEKAINIDEYLSVGVNTITLNFIGVTTQASAVASVRYTVVNLSIESTWDNTVAQEYDDMLDPDLLFDSDKGNALRIPFKAIGQGAKYIEIYVNGEQLQQGNKGISFGDLLSGQQEYSSRLDIFLCNENGTLNSRYFKDGKNTIQFRIFIDSDGRKIYSNTLYYDFVIKNVNSNEDLVYILYKQTLSGVFSNEETVEFKANQYFSTSFDYSVYSSTGKSVGLTFDLVKQAEGDELSKKIATLQRSIASGEQQTFEYSFLDYGTIHITITTDLKDVYGKPLDTLLIIVDVSKADVQISVAETDRTLNLEALNRSNSEPNPGVWESGSVKAEFENIYWNDSAGWDGKTLVLNNGALCSIPFNFFGTNENDLHSLGLTVEITFEMINVQDEEALMVSFEDSGAANTSSIKMTASEARLTDGAGTSVHTKYNANTKIKLAFVVNPYDRNNNFDPSYTGKQEYKNCNFIMVNGILDKAEAFSGKLIWTNVANPKLVLGNKDGKAGIKVYSIRVYRKALSLDEELTNWIAESDDILAMNKRNNIYSEYGSSVSLDIVKNMIPTAVLYGDIDQFNRLTGKKENMQFDMEFYDPTDSDRDFYARGLWMSNQGTSSLAYPIRNLRPYFSKTRDSKTQEDSANYYTELYLAGNFTHGEVTNEEKLKHFYTNAKTCSKGYHKLYNDAQADKLQADGVQLFYLSDGKYIPCKKGLDAAEGTSDWYIQAYREIKQYGEVDDYWKFVKDLRMSGAKIYKVASEEEIENPVLGNKYLVPVFEQVKGKKALNKETKYYIQQGMWKQYHKSGYTDRWTFKADYAESTMTQNAGVGRLWGDCMKNVQISGKYECRTDAQTAVGNRVTADDPRIDIRTSCDGKPIVAFCCPLLYDDDKKPIIKNGVRQYGDPIFIGLYNIMTDKSSTKLFGFEDIYDENGEKIYQADRTECFECLTNASEFSQGLSIISDSYEIDSKGQKVINENMADRSIWTDYESRWPDVKFANKEGSEEQVAHTHNLESMWRFVNFCKPAVDYFIGVKDSDAAVDGYTQSPYSLIDPEKYEEYWDMVPRPAVFTAEISGGNIEYKQFSATDLDEWKAMSGLLYEYKNDFDYDRVWKELSGKKIEGHVYKGKVAGFDAKHGVFLEDIQFDEERVDDETNGVNFGDPIAGTPCETDYYINVYLTKVGSRYTYVDEHGDTVNYTGESIEADGYEKNSKGESFSGKTYMEYFSEKKYDYFNVPRLAAYYVYLIRFAAADQFVKNSMLTTEDGQHYYYINYDNDTVLGTRNDGNLVFHWSVNRDTYDYEKNSFCFAGPKSVLWNLLEMDDDFMNQVQIVDNAMYASNVLSASIALDMFNNKQEGSWGERMYNINEKYKYLSQWHGDDAKYLAFIHGSANQFRSWFVENRFNYYDSLWESGEYMKSATQIRLDTMGTNVNNPEPMFYITAARQNKFFLSNSDGKYKNVEAWKKTLNQDQKEPWLALYPIYGNSSPWTLYGCDKIKELDFRPSTGVFDLQYLSFVENGSNWMDDKGTLMTKLLIGTSDEFRSTPMFRYTNITDEDVVLSQAVLSGTKTYETAEDLEFDESVITREKNEKTGNWIYKSKDGSEAILPIIVVKVGGFYDSISQISNVDESKVSMTGLDKTQCSITAIGSIGKLYSLEEIDIRNCYNEAGLLNDSINLTGLNNLHIYRAIGSSITSFIPAIGAILNEVSLPSKRVNTITLDNVTFKKASEDQTAPVFMYTPDAALTNISFNNVLFGDEDSKIDFVEFVNTWVDAHKKANTESLKGLTITLNGVDIPEATPEWLVMLKNELNLVSFTGTVYVKGSDVNGKMTEEEYNLLNSVYKNEQPFEPNSALRFNSAPAIFWAVDGAEAVEVPSTTVWGPQSNGKYIYNKYYKMLHGNTLKFKVTQFPVENTGMQLYMFDYINGTTTNSNWVTMQKSVISNAQGIAALKNTNFNITLTPDPNSGMSTFISDLEGANENVNQTRYIAIYPVDSNRNKIVDDADTLFIELNPAVLPKNLNLNYNGEELVAETTEQIEFTIDTESEVIRKDAPVYKITVDKDDTDYQIDITYSNENEVTVDGMVPTVYIYDADQVTAKKASTNDLVSISKVIKGNITVGEKTGGSFNIKGFVNPENRTQRIAIVIPMLTGLDDKYRVAFLDVTVKVIKPNGVQIGYPEDKTKVTITRGLVSELDKDIAVDNISVFRPISLSDGLLIPIAPVTDTKNGISNLPIMDIEINPITDEEGNNLMQYNYGVVKQPTIATEKIDANTEKLIVDENGNCFIKIETRQSSTSYDFEYEFDVTGHFGYRDRSVWENNTKYTFSYRVRLDISVIYPNAFKVVYIDNESDEIQDRYPTINASDGDSKEIKFKIVPYNSTVKDPITVDMERVDVELTIPTNEQIENDVDDVLGKLQFGFNVMDAPDAPGLISYSIDNSDVSYPVLSLTLHKYYNVWGGDLVSQNIIQFVKCGLTVSGTYKTDDNKSQTVPAKELEFNVSQSVSFTETIDECAPYAIGTETDGLTTQIVTDLQRLFPDISEYDDNWLCPWYLVDIDNQYYKINNDTISQLKTEGMLDNLIGVAKRINYGWDDENAVGGTPFMNNAEQGGDNTHNACLYWDDENVDINVIGRSDKTKNTYFRALCLPLANWKVRESDIISKGGENKTPAQATENYYEINDVSAFFVNTCRMFSMDISDNYMYDKYKEYSAAESAIKNCMIYALHAKTDAAIITKMSNGYLRPTNITSAPNTYGELTSLSGMRLSTGSMSECSWSDALAPMEKFCEGLEKITTKEAWGTKAWDGTASMRYRQSGVVNVWNHFRFYDISSLSGNSVSTADASKINCYIPSGWELKQILCTNPTRKEVVNVTKGRIRTFAEIEIVLKRALGNTINLDSTFAKVLNDNLGKIYKTSLVGKTGGAHPFFGSMTFLGMVGGTGLSGANPNGYSLWEVAQSPAYGEGEENDIFITPMQEYTLINTSSTTNQMYCQGGSQIGNGYGLWIPLLIVK